MGRLGWDYETVRRTDVNAIALALEGHDRLLSDVFGSEDDKKPKPFTAGTFKDRVKAHNAAFVSREVGHG